MLNKPNFYDFSIPWTDVSATKDLEFLLQSFGYFHDSCLREFYLSTSCYVNADLSMSLRNSRTATLLFQRQFRRNSVLEMRFLEVIGLNYQPPDLNYNEVIDSAVLIHDKDIFYWADHEGWTLDAFKEGDTESVWVGGKSLSYRFRPELVGKVERFHG